MKDVRSVNLDTSRTTTACWACGRTNYPHFHGSAADAVVRITATFNYIVVPYVDGPAPLTDRTPNMEDGR